MPPTRLPGLIFVVFGVGLIVFRRAAARQQIAYNRRFYADPAGRALYLALSYIVPGGWLLIGVLSLLGRLPSTGPNARIVPYLGLTQGDLAGLIAFLGGALMLVFHGPLVRRYERHLKWLATPAGERAMERMTAAIGLVFATVGTLVATGIIK